MGRRTAFDARDPAGRTPAAARTVRDARARAGPVFRRTTPSRRRRTRPYWSPRTRPAPTVDHVRRPGATARTPPTARRPRCATRSAAVTTRRPIHLLRHPADGLSHATPR